MDGTSADAEGCVVDQRSQVGLRLPQRLLDLLALGHVVGKYQFLLAPVLLKAKGCYLGE